MKSVFGAIFLFSITTSYPAFLPAGQPNSQPSNFVVNNRTTTSVSVTFSNAPGNPNGYLLVYKAGSSPTNGAPVDGVSYPIGSSLGGGNVGGAGSPVFNVTGLTAGTQYFFDIYSYNTGGGNNYLQTNPLEGSAWTLASEPTVQPNTLSFNSVTSAGFNATFLAAFPAPSGGYIALRRAGSPVTDSPIDGISYAVGSTIGSSTVSYIGTDVSFFELALLSATTYHYKIIPFGLGLNPATANYYLAAPLLTGNITTLSPSPSVQASNLTFSSVSENSLTLTWLNGDGSRRLVVGRAGSSVDRTPVNATSYIGTAAFGTGAQLGNGNYVLYDGTGSSLLVTGLAPETMYSFEVFEYNGTGTTKQYLTTAATQNPRDQTTLSALPSIQASNITFTSLGASQITLNWTNGNGARRLLLAQESAAISSLPIDATAYAVGSSIGGAEVVYDGAESSATVGSLNPSTVYYFRLFEYNGSAATLHYATGTAPGNPASHTTLAPAVTTQANQLVFSNITTTQTTLTWSRGNGAKVIILARKGAPVDVTPASGTTYVPNDIFGNGTALGGGNYVVYDGTGNSVVVGGLTAGSTYHFQVYEYNGSGVDNNFNINVAAGNPKSQATVPNAPVAQNSSNEQSSTFIANWSETEGASAYELDVTLASENFATYVPGYQGHLISDGTQTQEVVMGLSPNTIYKSRVRARNSGGLSENSASKVVVTLKASGSTVLAPTISITGSGTSSINIITANGFNPQTNVITFLHRKIADTDFTAEAPVTAASAHITVNPDWLDQLGMEYYVKVTDEAEKLDSTASMFIYSAFSNVNLCANSGFVPGGKSETYRLFSIPMQLSSVRIEDIFQPIIAQYGGIDKTKWRLEHYQGGQNIGYGAGLTTIESGRGYWFNSLDTPQPVLLSGPVIPANQRQGFVLTLDEGFTQIGNPYPFDVSWNDILLKNALVPGIEGVGPLYTFDAARVAFNKDAGLLKVWEGGFVHSNERIQLIVPVVSNSSTTGKLTIPEKNLLSESDWYVPMTLTQGTAYNNDAGIGMQTHAEEGYDPYDNFTLPRFVNYLEFNSRHPDYHTPKFSRDIVPTADHYNWNFDVESNFEQGEVELNWNNQAFADTDAQLLLYDVFANTILDMKKVNHYRFGIDEKRSFKVFYGIDEKSLSPDLVGLGHAYPNPFHRISAVPFITSAARPAVQIVVYDLQGRKVRALANGRFEPGYHEVTWDGTDEQGLASSPGVFLYRLTSENGTSQIGRIVYE